MNATEEQSNRESPSGTERSPKEEETVSLGTAESSSSPSCRPLKKRRLEMQNDKVDATESTKETEASSGMSQKRQISFNDGRNVTHLQTDPSHDFPSEYKESDIWYTVRLKFCRKNMPATLLTLEISHLSLLFC
jgi:hypothetical protein